MEQTLAVKTLFITRLLAQNNASRQPVGPLNRGLINGGNNENSSQRDCLTLYLWIADADRTPDISKQVSQPQISDFQALFNGC